MKTNLTHEKVPTNGIHLHVVYAGPKDGPAVVLLHGFPEFWRGWLKQITPLADAGYHVIVPDQRGYNLSDKPKEVTAYHIDILTQDILGLIDVTRRESAIVVGHDWGAAIAWHLASTYPERVEKLGILNVPHPAVLVQTLRSSLEQLRKSWYIFFFQIPCLPEVLLGWKDARGASELILRSGKPDTFTVDDLDHYRKSWTQPGALRGMLNWYRSAFRSGFKDFLDNPRSKPRITVPTLILWGVQDVALSYEMAQKSIELCEDGELIAFEDATHWVQHDEPESVAQRLIKFFDEESIIR